MLKKMAFGVGSLAILLTVTGCSCLPNCCYLNAAINGLDLLRDLFNYQIAI